MKSALWITGILTAVALTSPELVAAGYFFLIIPGLILTLAPTAFIYLAGTAAIRRVLPIASPRWATALGFLLMLGLGWLVMQPFRSSALNAYHAQCQPDIAADLPIELKGHVRIEAPELREGPDCNYLCLALLDFPEVESVTIVTGGRRKKSHGQNTAAFVLESAEHNSAVGLFPQEPGQILREFRPAAKVARSSNLRAAVKAVEADWAVRLAGPTRLRETDPVPAEVADWVIHIDQKRREANSTIRRVTVCDSTGAVKFRKSLLKSRVPAGMFYLGFEAFAGGGTISGASFHIARQTLYSGERSLRPESELLTAINCPVPKCDASSIARLRNAAEQALDNPEPSDVQLDLARRYLGLFFFDAKERDYQFIARIVSDNRVKDIEAQLKNVFSKTKTPLVMRNAYAERIVMNDTSAKLRRWLAECLTELPPGTFANPTATHLKIWNSPANYRDAGAFFSRTADLGAEQALPILDTALDAVVSLPTWIERRPLATGIREAFIQLGPSASEAAPRVTKLFLNRPSPLMHNSGEADQWRLALARMGVAVQDLPFFPGQSPKSVQRICREVTQKLHKYQEERVSD